MHTIAILTPFLNLTSTPFILQLKSLLWPYDERIRAILKTRPWLFGILKLFYVTHVGDIAMYIFYKESILILSAFESVSW